MYKHNDMNYALAKEMYGTPWCIDLSSYLTLSKILQDIRGGVVYDSTEEKCNSIYLHTSNETKLITRGWQLDNREDFEGVGIIKINGAITRNGGESSYGMVHISSMMKEMAQDNRVKGFVILTDSGGGSSSAVDLMQDTITEIRQTKPVYGLIEKGGMAASAAYGILSATSKIFAEDKMAIVGSVGTMIEFDGYAANSQSPDGEKHIRLYATASINKNKGFEEALNNDNYDVLIKELLNPINENFMQRVEGFRPQLKGADLLDGSTQFSGNSIGILVDDIASLNQVVEMVINDSKSLDIINNKSNSRMTKEEFKNSHPEIYQEVYSEGVTAGTKLERDRCGAWMVHADATSLEEVTAGIEGGEPISQTQTQKFLKNKSNAQALAELEQGSAGAINREQAGNETPENKEFNAAFDFTLTKKK